MGAVMFLLDAFLGVVQGWSWKFYSDFKVQAVAVSLR